MPIAVGSKAPDFTLKSRTPEGFKDVKLSDNFGKKQTVLLFFPAAFSSVCTAEMCDKVGGLGDYESLGGSVLAISVDNALAQEAWAKQNKITVTLLSDLNKTVTPRLWRGFPGFRRHGRNVGARRVRDWPGWRGEIRRADRHAERHAEFCGREGRARQVNFRTQFVAVGPWAPRAVIQCWLRLSVQRLLSQRALLDENREL